MRVSQMYEKLTRLMEAGEGSKFVFDRQGNPITSIHKLGDYVVLQETKVVNRKRKVKASK